MALQVLESGATIGSRSSGCGVENNFQMMPPYFSGKCDDDDGDDGDDGGDGGDGDDGDDGDDDDEGGGGSSSRNLEKIMTSKTFLKMKQFQCKQYCGVGT